MLMRPISFLTAVCLCACIVHGQILNGGFEEPIPSDPNVRVSPSDWQVENYAILFQSFSPVPHDVRQDWTIPAPIEGDFFVLLSTGNPSTSSDTSIRHSSIEQVVYLCPGDKIVGSYFFGAGDYIAWDDFATVKIISEQSQEVVYSKILDSVNRVGSYKSSGWRRFGIFFNQNCGFYKVRFQIEDYVDQQLNSYLALDDLFICSNMPQYGDLNHDCKVDLEDFSILAAGWLTYCDTRSYSIPMTPIELSCEAAKMNDDPNVDIFELTQIANNWLFIYDPLPGE